MERKPSEIIADFINLCEKSHEEYKTSKAEVEEYDKKTLDWIHKIENLDKAEERSKVSTAWHAERLKRRKLKNNMALYEKTHDYAINELNKGALKRLKAMLTEQIKTERWIESEDKELKSQRIIE